MEEIKITEEIAQKIIDTKSTDIKETGVLNDLELTKKERIKHAKNILKSRRK